MLDIPTAYFIVGEDGMRAGESRNSLRELAQYARYHRLGVGNEPPVEVRERVAETLGFTEYIGPADPSAVAEFRAKVRTSRTLFRPMRT